MLFHDFSLIRASGFFRHKYLHSAASAALRSIYNGIHEWQRLHKSLLRYRLGESKGGKKKDEGEEGRCGSSCQENTCGDFSGPFGCRTDRDASPNSETLAMKTHLMVPESRPENNFTEDCCVNHLEIRIVDLL